MFLKAKFHPEIDSPEEESVRKAQFAKTHKMIEEHNSDPEATHQLTHNHFSAMVCIWQEIHIIQMTKIKISSLNNRPTRRKRSTSLELSQPLMSKRK